MSNGITEGCHYKIEMILRRAYGFRNFNNYRLRVLALCGWSGIINRMWYVYRFPTITKKSRKMEAGHGIEPKYTALQAAA